MLNIKQNAFVLNDCSVLKESPTRTNAQHDDQMMQKRRKQFPQGIFERKRADNEFTQFNAILLFVILIVVVSQSRRRHKFMT